MVDAVEWSASLCRWVGPPCIVLHSTPLPSDPRPANSRKEILPLLVFSVSTRLCSSTKATLLNYLQHCLDMFTSAYLIQHALQPRCSVHACHFSVSLTRGGNSIVKSIQWGHEMQLLNCMWRMSTAGGYSNTVYHASARLILCRFALTPSQLTSALENFVVFNSVATLLIIA